MSKQRKSEPTLFVWDVLREAALRHGCNALWHDGIGCWCRIGTDEDVWCGELTCECQLVTIGDRKTGEGER